MDRRVRHPDVIALACLLAIGVGAPLWMAAAGGAVGIPSNDDWVYIRAALILFHTGALDMQGHTAAAIGQIALVQPLLWLSGGASWPFTAFGLAMAAIGIAATYVFARRFLPTGSAVMAVLLLLAFPGFLREAASFMTDVPAYSLAIVCLLLGVRWLQADGSRAWLVISVVLGVLAFSIREFAIAAPAAILLAAWARNARAERVFLAAASAFAVAGVLAVRLIATSAPGAPVLLTPQLGQFGLFGPGFVTLAAVLLPAVALAVGRQIATFDPRHLVLGAALACLAAVMPGGPLVGNLWTADGLGGNALLAGLRDPVIDDRVWAFSNELAVFAAILLAALAVRWVHRTFATSTTTRAMTTKALEVARGADGPLILFVALYAGALFAYTVFGQLFDRYLYPIVPVASILLLRAPAGRVRFGASLAASNAAFAWLAVSAVVVAANSFAYDGARYRAGEAAVAMGYEPATVDAGLEWVGYQATGVERLDAADRHLAWYDDLWPSLHPCAVVSNKPLATAGYTSIRIEPFAYRQYLFFGPTEALYVAGARDPTCPQSPLAGAGGQAPSSG